MRHTIEKIDPGGAVTNETPSGLVGRFGGGVDIYQDTNSVLGFAVTYVVASGDVSDKDYVSLTLGYQYRF